MKSAITVMTSQHSFLQNANVADLGSIAATLKVEVERNKVFISPTHKKVILAFAQDPDGFMQKYDGFGGSTANAGSYAPQSGAIFGILKNMKESFEHNLASSQKEEISGVKSYEELKGAKESA